MAMEISGLITRARLIWTVVTLFIAAICTGVGFLIAEGSARASFDGKWQDHEKRIAVIEAFAVSANTQNIKIIGELGEIKGELKGVSKMLRGSRHE